MSKTIDRNLLIDVFSIPVKKKKRTTRFSKLYDRARAKGFELERIDDCPDGKYEVFSNEKELGVTRVCQNLNKVETEVLDIESKF